MGAKKGFVSPPKTTKINIKVKKSLTDLQYEEIFAAVLQNTAAKSPSEAETSRRPHAAEPEESASLESNLGHKKNRDTSLSNSQTKSNASSKATFEKRMTYRDMLNILESSHSQADSLVSSLNRSFTGNPLSQPPQHLSHRERLEWLQNRRGTGLWVRCDRPTCQKWRFLNIVDPVDTPKKWDCSLNTDKHYNDCAIPEQKLTFYIDEDMIHNEYTAGSIVWAKLIGYPWWPAMVDDCPDTEQYYWLNGFSDIPVDYNVTFLDDNDVTRAWIKSNNLVSFKHNPNYDHRFVIPNKYKSALALAKRNAEIAVKLSIKDRLKMFSFLKRWPHEINSPLPSEADSDDSEGTRARKVQKMNIYMKIRQSSMLIKKDKLKTNTVKHTTTTTTTTGQENKQGKARRQGFVFHYEDSSDEEIYVKKITKRRHTIAAPKSTDENWEPMKKIQKRKNAIINNEKAVLKEKKIVKRRNTDAERTAEPKRINKRRNTEIIKEKPGKKQKTFKPIIKKVDVKQTETPKTPKKRVVKQTTITTPNNSREDSLMSIVISSDEEGENKDSEPQLGARTRDSITIIDDSFEDGNDQNIAPTQNNVAMDIYTQSVMQENRLEQSVMDEIILELQNKHTILTAFEAPNRSKLSDSFEKLPTIPEEEEEEEEEDEDDDDDDDDDDEEVVKTKIQKSVKKRRSKQLNERKPSKETPRKGTKSPKGKQKVGATKTAEVEFKKPNQKFKQSNGNDKNLKSPTVAKGKSPKRGFIPPLLKPSIGSSSKSQELPDDKSARKEEIKANGLSVLVESQNLFDEEDDDVNFEEFKSISEQCTSSQTVESCGIEVPNTEDNLMHLLGNLSPSSLQFDLDD